MRNLLQVRQKDQRNDREEVRSVQDVTFTRQQRETRKLNDETSRGIVRDGRLSREELEKIRWRIVKSILDEFPNLREEVRKYLLGEKLWEKLLKSYM